MPFFTTGIIIYILVCAFIFGSIFGSAMNCLAIRIAHHEKWGGKSRSKCPSCGHTLGAFDLIPVVSYIALGGKCRYCKTKISPRYLISEIILGLCFSLLAYKTICDLSASYEYLTRQLEFYSKLSVTPAFSPVNEYNILVIGNIAEFILNAIFVCCLFALSLCDLETFEIPDRFIIIPAILRVVFVFLFGSNTVIFGNGNGILNYYGIGALKSSKAWTDSLLSVADVLIVGLAIGTALLLLSLFMDKILKKSSLGGGDIKLLATVGLFLKPSVLLLAVLLSCILGIVPSLFARKEEKNESEENQEPTPSNDEEVPEGAFPFGPAIAVASFVCLCFGEKIVNLYLSITGIG